MPRRRRSLALVGLGWTLIARTALAMPGASLPACLRWLGWLAPHLPAPPGCTPEDAAWAITAAARRVPGTRCLAWALALHGLLRQAGIASELRIGVAPVSPGIIKVHAWIECAGLTWSWGDARGYSVLWPRPATS